MVTIVTFTSTTIYCSRKENITVNATLPSSPSLKPTVSTMNTSTVSTINTSTVSTMNITTVLPEKAGFSKQLEYYSSKIYRNGSEGLYEKCTLVIQTFRLDIFMSQVIQHYCRMHKHFQKILVITNNKIRRFIDIIPHCFVKIEFVKLLGHKFTSRFKPRKEIETDCKLI